ncbi:MAG: ROK family protein [Methanoregulaceae archaeon]|nr:ROK family protein [Methanoregulaceae archaeon]
MGYVVAVDLGATNSRAGIIDENGTIMKKIWKRTPSAEADAAILTSFIARLIADVISDLVSDNIAGIGLSVAGPVDIQRGVLLNPPNMHFRDVPLTATLSRVFNIPVRMVNDCHAGILGEMQYGQGRDRAHVVYLTISTGIGGGVVSGGRILLGRAGNAAEIGHLHVDNTYNLTCSCGHSGHWEGYASGRFIPSFFAAWCKYHSRKNWGLCKAEDIFLLAWEGNEDVHQFLVELAKINARGISDVIVAYDPEIIIFDGAVMLPNADLIIPPMIAAVDRYLALPDIVMTRLDGDAPLLGASLIARGYATDFLTLKD